MENEEEDNIFVPEDEDIWAGVSEELAFKLRDDVWELMTGEPMSIWCAAYTGNIKRIKEHIKNGVDINSTADGQSVLHFACESGVSEEAVDLLISKKANLNSKNSHGDTPLHLSLRKRNEGISNKLIDGGANPNIENNLGKKPGEDADEPRVIVERTKYDSIHQAALKGDIKLIQKFIDQYIDVDMARDSNGRTPLHSACLRDQKNIANLLICSEADVNAPDCDGMRPIHYAAYWGAIHTLKLLINEYGAEINLKDAKNRTPLDLARDSESNEKHRIAALIVANGGISGSDQT